MRPHVEGVHHVEPSFIRSPSGIEVPCPLGAIEFEADCVTVVCSDCGQEVLKDPPENMTGSEGWWDR